MDSKRFLFIGTFAFFILFSLLTIFLFYKDNLDFSQKNDQVSYESQPYMRLQIIDDAVDKKALCMDGSPAFYYSRPGFGDGEDRWVFWIEGGSSCHDSDGCKKARKDPDFSSESAKATKKGNGILSENFEDNPDFYNWNHVYLNNCNAGNWGGDDVVVIDGKNYYFYGYHVLRAVADDLIDLGDAEYILLTGSSGGGTGVSVSLDRFAGWYPQSNVMGVIDSAYELDVDPYEVTKVVSPSDGFEFVTTHVDESCEQVYQSDPWNCLIKEYLYPYLSTPVFTYQDLIDEHKLEDFGITDRSQPDQNAWVLSYEQKLIDSLRALDGVFAPTVGDHVALTNARFTDKIIDGLSFSDVLANWVFDRSGPKNVIADPK